MMVLVYYYFALRIAVRNDRNKKRRQKAESTSGGMFGAGTEELSEEDQALIADVVDAYRATIPLLEDQGNSLPYLKPNVRFLLSIDFH